ncbi:MAG: hypothetical protein WAX89_08220, partial [Alphaproteobacteria bacterium]
ASTGAISLNDSDVTLGGNLTTTNDLIAIEHNLITTGASTFTTAGGAMTVGGGITASGALTFTTGGGDVTVGDDVASTGAVAFTTSGGDVDIGGDLVTGGTTSFATAGGDTAIGGNTTLGGNATFTSGGGDVELTGTTDGAYSLTATLGAGTFTATGDMGGITPLTDVTITANQMNLGNITVTNGMTYDGEILTSGLLSAGQAVNMTGDVVLGGGVTTSNGDITIGGAVVLTADSILRSGGTGTDTISIGSSITGDYVLTFDAGLANIDIAGNVDIGQWVFSSGEDLNLGGTFTTDASMNFANLDTITVDADSTFTSTSGDITMGSNNVITGPYSLTFDGDIVTLYDVGGINPATDPTSLTVNATTFYLLGGVTTSGVQTYTSLDGLASDLLTSGADINLYTDISLLGDVTISTGAGLGGNIYLGGTIDGGYALTLTAGLGNITTTSAIGETTALSSLTMQGQNYTLYGANTTGAQDYTGGVTLLGDVTSAGGNISFHDEVTLGDDVRISSGDDTGGNLLFENAVNGNFDLTVGAGSGNITFNEAVGGTTRLDVFTIESAEDIRFEEGLRVRSFVERRSHGSTEFGYNPGLDVLETITISRPSTITGRIAGTSVILESTGSIRAEVVADELTIGGTQSYIAATVAGERGRQAARRVRFTSLSSGPHLVNGYNIPLLEAVTAPYVLNTTRLGESLGSQPLTIDGVALADMELNPAAGNYSLLTDMTGLAVDSSLVTGDLWSDEWDDGVEESDLSPLSAAQPATVVQ